MTASPGVQGSTKGVAEAMEVVMHPLFLVPLATVVTWIVCRWWYRGQLRALENPLPSEGPATDAYREDRKSDEVPFPPWPSGVAGNAAALRLSSLGGGPVLPFLDTSPLSHFAEPEPDLFAHVGELGVRGAGDRPYLN